MATNDQKSAERIESAAHYFEREEFELAHRAHDVRTALVTAFTVAIFGSVLFLPNGEQVGTILLLLGGASVLPYRWWYRRQVAAVDDYIWVIWCRSFDRDQIVALRYRVRELRSARNPVRHAAPSLPLDSHLRALNASTPREPSEAA